ncbi:YcdB/YcdC domain-containing protein [Salibacterium qingdaonense]|uniref:S-layer homology domain-containing protein n=1 Tax=Salibacterium qingdaonense TaxID=266892 RepID=A0A1I4PL19_9BACI|nr:YcdB/YcdC domain-containing protein [Salibacterium qingdaonense]SFM28531.1 S-layer homology domain-containing protein [Salibacterium qingdaonense]
MNYRKIGIVSLSTALAIGSFTASVSAEEAATKQTEAEGEQMVEISSADVDFTKEDLINRFNELFPSRFDSLENSDFRMSHLRGPGSEEDVLTHHLSFDRETTDGKRVYGNVRFIGEELQLQSFTYQPGNVQDALYPAEVTQEEAEAVAREFVNNTASGDYTLSEQQRPTITAGNQTLTDPVEYQFTFQRMKNGIPVQHQTIRAAVLGNGELSSYSHGTYQQQSASYEEQENILAEEEAETSMKENLDLRLQYAVQHDYQTDEQDVSLVYVPSPTIQGIHAKTGEWSINNSFVSELPEEEQLQRLREEPLEEESAPVSREDVKQMAKDLLTVSGDAELNIRSIQETTRNGVDVFSLRYMIQRGSSGHGTNFVVEKETGDIVDFRNVDYSERSPEENLTKEEALEAAVEAAETYGSSFIHEFAYPVDNESSSPLNSEGTYRFSFPQVKNGLPVQGSSLSITVSAEDGELVSFNNRRNGDITNWPDPENAVDKETALEDYKNELNADLSYASHAEQGDTDTYHLVYQPSYQSNGLYYDAAAGEWTESQLTQNESPAEEVVTDHWAADQINYMVQSGILSTDEEKELKPNEAVSKGTALEMLMKSMENFYPGNPNEEQTATFENIQPDHSSFQVVEQAVESGVINAENNTFPVDETLTREELAVWIVRVLNLEQAAKHKDIYNLPFEDASGISEKYAGHVALAHAEGILQGSDGRFNPDDDVTLAHLAVTCFRLAEKQPNNQ